MRIYFESGATYITASDNNGNVKIRCNFDYTDCGQEENLTDFISRHGGAENTAQYLIDCYKTFK